MGVQGGLTSPVIWAGRGRRPRPPFAHTAARGKPLSGNNEWYFTVQGRGPDLVLIHGLGASSFSWRHNVAPLAAHFRVWTLDFPPHGRSPFSLTADYSQEALARGIMSFMERQGIRQAALAGNSLGGGLALLLARDYPERVPALALLAPAAAMTRLPWLFYPMGVPGLSRVLAPLLGPWLIPLALGLAYHRRELITPEVVEGYAAPFREGPRRLALGRLCRQLKIPPRSQTEAWLKELRPPTLIIWGEEDRILPVDQARWLKARLPQAEMHLMPQVGHAPQEEAPDEVNKIIIAFLTRSLKN